MVSSKPELPPTNGQCERTNGTILNAVSLGLKTLNLRKEKWEVVLQMALSSVRGLMCIATNERMINF